MPGLSQHGGLDRLRGWLSHNLWFLTAVNLTSGFCFLAGSYLFFYAAYAFEGTASWFLGSLLMIVDGICNGVLRHGGAEGKGGA